ncbi:NUDIX hydrolase [Micrococcus endophyticus]|uniref:NUDIX hydrolase n=1 Tax=Micrococcus endophyticus TaxID=455343 RepID=UPI0035A93BCE
MSPAAPSAAPSAGPADGDRPDVPAVPASSLMLVRPEQDGDTSVFALRRAASMAFSAHATAFPGGRVDPADDLPDALWEGTDLAAWGRRLGLPHEPVDALGALAALDPAEGAGRVLAAAVRETFEETGVLLARDAATGAPVDPDRVAALPDDLRDAVERHEVDFGDLLRDEGLRPDAGALVPWSRWITPHGGPRRYDTFFFAVHLPAGQSPERMSSEAAEHGWASPAELLRRFRAGEVNLMAPTWWQLRTLADAGEDVHAGRSRFEPLEGVMLVAGQGPAFSHADEYLRDLAAFRAAAQVEESKDNIL